MPGGSFEFQSSGDGREVTHLHALTYDLPELSTPCSGRQIRTQLECGTKSYKYFRKTNQ